MVGCEICVNYESSTCVECEYCDYPRENYYEEATPELIAKRKAEYRKKLEGSVVGEEIRMGLPQEFIDIFNRTKRFTAKDNLDLLAVYAGQTSLIAINKFSAIELNCFVPIKLRRRHILRIENNTATTSKEGLPVEIIDKLWIAASAIIYPRLHALLNTNGDYYTLKLNNSQLQITFDPGLLDPILEELGEINYFGYTANRGERSPVLFISDKGRAVLMPLLIIDSLRRGGRKY